MKTVEQIFENQNPQDGTLPEWAKKLAEEYANQSRNLLKKYIHHVVSCEGTDFTDAWHTEIQFTEQELEELKKLSKEPLTPNQ